METLAVVMEEPQSLHLRCLELNAAGDDEVVVKVDFSGVSTGTERLLWSGRMPPFPGLGYPLVPGYESVGRIVDAGPGVRERIGERVFVPGSSAFKGARGLFGGAARRLVAPSRRVLSIPEDLAEAGVLIALAATARHALVGGDGPDLIVGHGVLGRLLARIALAEGRPSPTVWETVAERRGGACGYEVVHPDQDPRCDYGAVFDASGDAAILNRLIPRLARGGEVVLAGFYEAPISFDFPPAFMREARIRIAAEFTPEDLRAAAALIASGRLDLGGLVTHRLSAIQAGDAYRTAFTDPSCLKMVLDWRRCA